MRWAVHIFTTGKVGALPAASYASLYAARSLKTDTASLTQAGCILTPIAACAQMALSAHQAAVGDAVDQFLFIHEVIGLLALLY
jgi:hypothetical protein